jgi:RNA polymerase sigma factor (TIGR02999 family)
MSEPPGPPPEEADRLLPLVYDELRALAGHYLAGERPGHTLQPTALVHEAFVRLAQQSRVDWQGRTHFLAVGAQAMRRILIDHARGRGRERRGGAARRVPLEGLDPAAPVPAADLLALGEALERLAALDPRQARVVELRCLGGLSMDEVAAELGVSKRTVEGDWKMARAWLRRALREGPADEP